MGQRFAGREVYIIKIGPHHFPPVLCGGGLESTKDRCPSVFDKDIHLPKPGDCVFHEALYIVFVSNVSGVYE